VTPDGLKAKLAEKIGAVYVGIEDMSGMCILSDRGGVETAPPSPSAHLPFTSPPSHAHAHSL
jgi:hypothetical protein